MARVLDTPVLLIIALPAMSSLRRWLSFFVCRQGAPPGDPFGGPGFLPKVPSFASASRVHPKMSQRLTWAKPRLGAYGLGPVRLPHAPGVMSSPALTFRWEMRLRFGPLILTGHPRLPKCRSVFSCDKDGGGVPGRFTSAASWEVIRRWHGKKEEVRLPARHSQPGSRECQRWAVVAEGYTCGSCGKHRSGPCRKMSRSCW